MLLSLDIDGDRDNGISIPAQAAAYATPFDFEDSYRTLQGDPAVIYLLENSGSVTTEFPLASDALNYLYRDSLHKLDYDLNVVKPTNRAGKPITLDEPYFDYGSLPSDHKLRIEATEGNLGGFELVYAYDAEPYRSALVIN